MDREFLVCGQSIYDTQHHKQQTYDSHVILSIYPLLDCPWVSVVNKKSES